MKKYFTTYLNSDAMAQVKEDCPTPSSSAFNIPKLDEEWKEFMDEEKKNFPML